MSPAIEAGTAANCVHDSVQIDDDVVIGHRYEGWSGPATVGAGCKIRRGSVIFADVVIGEGSQTGMGVYIREQTRIGRNCIIGTSTIIEGHVEIADDTVIQSGVFIPTHTRIGNRVFIGPRAVMTNDRYPLRMRKEYVVAGPQLDDDVTIGANATLLPGVRIGAGAVVAAGAVVVTDVPEWSLAVGVPAKVCDLPAHLREPNQVRSRS
jgi:acetyltransferase-like isoleucine patch superfamily enzyme